MQKFIEKSGILVWVLAAIILALVLGSVKIGDAHLVPQGIERIFVIFSTLFSQFLSFAIPLIIIGLVTPAVADLGRDAGRQPGVTTAIAYGSTLFSGLLTCLAHAITLLKILQGSLTNVAELGSAFETYFTVEIPAAVLVMTVPFLSFAVSIGLAMMPRDVLCKEFIEFRAIVTKLIEHIITPLLPLHVFGIFLNLTYTGEAWTVMHTLVRMVVVVLILEVVTLFNQYLIASVIGKKNPIKSFLTIVPACLTALDTSPPAATIPVALRQTEKNGVSSLVASFTVPLCATIYLAGLTSKIFAFAFVIAFTQGVDMTPVQWVGFMFMLDITVVATPSVPGDAIMAATGLLSSMLGFNDAQVALMIATYVTLDSFGTATNVTGDGAVAIVVGRFADGRIGAEGDSENACEPSFDGMKCLGKVPVEGLASAEEFKASAAQASENTVSN